MSFEFLLLLRRLLLCEIRRRRRGEIRAVDRSGVDSESDVSFDVREKTSLVERVSLDSGFGFRQRNRGAGDFDAAEELPGLIIAAVIVNGDVDSLVSQTSEVTDVEN
ncbi:unnamed protein product [Microthlaspi erraticum]|uniref:Uncharacterized protein n=1 Tax=Microthlaspi erraticum TaxID=1685480 RepID=A0A6D2IEE9_9BRAS|nr:unnamed protein product [Microthlaspi erraticum]